MKKVLYQYSERFLKFVLICFFISAAIVGVKCYAQTYIFKSSLTYANVIKQIIFIILMSIIASVGYYVILLRKQKQYCISRYYFILLILSVTLLTRIIWNILFNTMPISDYDVLYQGAVKMLHHQFNEAYDVTNYFYRFGFQIPYSFYLSLVMKIFGIQLEYQKLLNIIYTCITIVLIFFMTNKLYGEAAARVAAFTYSIFIYNIIASSVLSNQHIATMFFLIYIYLILFSDWKLRHFIAGVVLALGQLSRPIASVFIIATIIYYFLEFLNEKQLKQSLLSILKVVLVYTILINLVSISFVKFKYTPNLIGKNVMPYYKLVVGTDPSSNGAYFSKDSKMLMRQLVESNYNWEEYNTASKKVLIQRLHNPTILLKLFIKKFEIFWGMNDNIKGFSLSDSNLIKKYQKLYGHYFDFAAWIQYLFILFTGVIGAFALIKNHNIKTLFSIILLIGFTAVYLLIEIQTRYRYELYPILIMFSSIGITSLIHKKQFLSRKNL